MPAQPQLRKSAVLGWASPACSYAPVNKVQHEKERLAHLREKMRKAASFMAGNPQGQQSWPASTHLSCWRHPQRLQAVIRQHHHAIETETSEPASAHLSCWRFPQRQQAAPRPAAARPPPAPCRQRHTKPKRWRPSTHGTDRGRTGTAVPRSMEQPECKVATHWKWTGPTQLPCNSSGCK